MKYYFKSKKNPDIASFKAFVSNHFGYLGVWHIICFSIHQTFLTTNFLWFWGFATFWNQAWNTAKI